MYVNPAVCTFGSSYSITNCTSVDDPTAGFTDITSYPYKKFLSACVQHGIINGVTTSAFKPTTTANRAMFVTMMYRLAGSPIVANSHPFTDVPAGVYYSDAVRWAYKNNIINGTTSTTFSPGNAVTREQTATILYRYQDKYGDPIPSSQMNYNWSTTDYGDYSSVMPYAKTSMSWAVSAGLFQEQRFSSSMLYPQGNMTRAELAEAIAVLQKKSSQWF